MAAKGKKRKHSELESESGEVDRDSAAGSQNVPKAIPFLHLPNLIDGINQLQAKPATKTKHNRKKKQRKFVDELQAEGQQEVSGECIEPQVNDAQPQPLRDITRVLFRL
jgi:hypothetical protein